MRKILISIPFILVIIIGLFAFNFIWYKRYAYSDSILVQHGINRLYFAGLDPSYSIGNTLAAAENRNYRVSLIQDAIISKSGVYKKRKLLEFSHKGCEVLSSDDYFRKISDSK
jgi:nicotinamidase-related amidase